MRNYIERAKVLLKKKGLFYTIKTSFRFLINSYHPKWLFYKIKSKDNLIIKDIQGSKMILDLNDKGLSRELIFKGIREEWATKEFKKELKEGMNILEAGANKGYYLLIASKEIGNGKIFAFEPDPRSINFLKRNIELNNIKEKILLYDSALGNKNGAGEFFLSVYQNTSNLVDSFKTPGYLGEKIKVKIKKADDILKNERIDYVRMDVEGYEFEILKGMRDLLKNVKGMFIEVHPKQLEYMGTSSLELYNWIRKRGFYIKSASKISVNKNPEQAVMRDVNVARHVFFKKLKEKEK